jgi:hypothetical protein
MAATTGRSPAAWNSRFIKQFGGDGTFVPDTHFKPQFVDQDTYNSYLQAFRNEYGRDPKNKLAMQRVTDRRDPRGYDWYAFKDNNNNGTFEPEVDRLRYIDGVGLSRWNATRKQMYAQALANAGWADENGVKKLPYSSKRDPETGEITAMGWKDQPEVKDMFKRSRNPTLMDHIREAIKDIYNQIIPRQMKMARRKYSLLEAASDVLKAAKAGFEPGFFEGMDVAPEGVDGSEQRKLHNKQVRKLRASQEYFDGMLSYLQNTIGAQGAQQIISQHAQAAQGRPVPQAGGRPPAAKQPVRRPAGQLALEQVGVVPVGEASAPASGRGPRPPPPGQDGGGLILDDEERPPPGPGNGDVDDEPL